jgi:ferric-dicitrate binding protein FerR (iron transport regulator)
MRVVVAEGKVALRHDTLRINTPPVLTLRRGDLARVDRSGAATLTPNVDVREYLAFTEGRLVFDNTPLNEAVHQLARWYGADIRLADSASVQRPVVATFEDGSFQNTLDLLAQSLDLRVERAGGVILLHSSTRGRSTIH